MPALAAWAKQQQKSVKEMRASLDVLTRSGEDLQAAAALDIEALTAAAADASDEEIRTKLQAALRGAQRVNWMPPQAVLLSADHSTRWGVIMTPELDRLVRANPDLRRYFEFAGGAFQLALQQLAVQVRAQRVASEADSLPSLPGLERSELQRPVAPLAGGAAAAAPTSRAAPIRPSRIIRKRLTDLWQVLQPILQAAGKVGVGWRPLAVGRAGWSGLSGGAHHEAPMGSPIHPTLQACCNTCATTARRGTARWRKVRRTATPRASSFRQRVPKHSRQTSMLSC